MAPPFGRLPLWTPACSCVHTLGPPSGFAFSRAAAPQFIPSTASPLQEVFYSAVFSLIGFESATGGTASGLATHRNLCFAWQSELVVPFASNSTTQCHDFSVVGHHHGV